VVGTGRTREGGLTELRQLGCVLRRCRAQGTYVHDDEDWEENGFWQSNDEVQSHNREALERRSFDLQGKGDGRAWHRVADGLKFVHSGVERQ